jgi:dihydroorotate dehydrogenase
MIWERLLRPLLFKMDAETSHNWGMKLLKQDTLWRALNPTFSYAEKPTQFLGRPFRNPLGLAAGFDKNGEAVLASAALGFGFTEIGTVTPLPQKGNPRPRLFREPSTESLFNRMGFNNLGAKTVSENLSRVLEKMGADHPNFRIGVSVGKNADTELRGTARDSVSAAKYFRNKVDFVVVNLSSPNTKGLRSLQNKEGLKPVLESLKTELSGWKSYTGLVLKLAPEVKGEELSDLFAWIGESGLADAITLTNTLAGEFHSLPGGWSGGKVKKDSEESLELASLTCRLPIISVGGVFSEKDFLARLHKGATLVQSYTGFVYGGPFWPKKILSNFQTSTKI